MTVGEEKMTRLSIFFLAVVSLSTSPGRFRADEPGLKKVNLFEAGMYGYRHYRIPGVIVSPKGTIIVFCEARSGGDWSTIDICMRRSFDGGESWEKLRKISEPPEKVQQNEAALKKGLAKPGEVTMNNPVMIPDTKTGAIHFLYCIEYARCYYRRSDDDGRTFSKAVDITSTFDLFRKDYNWRVIATGPGHGLRTRSGRLIVPVWLSDGSGGHAHRPSAVSVIYSDDRGGNWKRGELVAADPGLKAQRAAGTPLLRNPGETAAVELQDGRILLNLRNESARRRRAISISTDGISGWSRYHFAEALVEPICMGSMVRLSEKPRYRKNRILFANPHNSASRTRQNVSVKLSYDEAKTWPVMKTIEAGPSGYSDLAVGSDGTIHCFYERGKTGSLTTFLCLATFRLEWLTGGEDRLVTPSK
ncbi:MAG: sialidase family protein [Planctomycetota bacterium]